MKKEEKERKVNVETGKCKYVQNKKIKGIKIKSLELNTNGFIFIKNII